MDSIPGALSSIKDRGLRMRLMLLSLTLGLSPDDQVICRGIEILENTREAVSARIDTNRILFVISIRSTLNGKRTFIRIEKWNDQSGAGFFFASITITWERALGSANAPAIKQMIMGLSAVNPDNIK